MFNLKKIVNNDGFTLLEILVASTIASLLILMTYQSYHTIMNSVKDYSGLAEYYENINLTMSKIDRDISNTYITKENFLISNVVNGQSYIAFTTVEHNDLSLIVDINHPVRESDIYLVKYEGIPYSDIDGLVKLVRRERYQFNDDTVTGGESNILIDNVVSIKFEFKLRNDWVDRWDTREHRRFPTAIKTTLTVKKFKGKEESFSQISLINIR